MISFDYQNFQLVLLRWEATEKYQCNIALFFYLTTSVKRWCAILFRYLCTDTSNQLLAYCLYSTLG